MSQIIKYNFQQVRSFMQGIIKAYDKDLSEALLFEDWKCLAFPNMYANPGEFKVVPWELGTTINIAPTAVEMQAIIDKYKDELQNIELNSPPERQDYEKTQVFKRILQPTHSFVINEPITVEGTLAGAKVHVPIWFNTTMKSVNVRLGFDKLDSAKPGAIPLSDAPVHMMLGGITGAGKSVALNDIICSLLLEYPPWELNLVLADFKIVELSRYANRIPTPHVSIVAATSSTEFALSTFDYIIKEMNARQEVFTRCGVQNIKDFRDKFNLCMPRILFIADEFVQMFENIKVAEQNGNENAAEQKRLILSDISAIARLGRSQGIHMLLSSQNMDGVLDEQTAGQFSAGASLAATNAISNTLIGNPAGSTIRGKGKAYVNLRKNEKNIEDNILVRVPYIQSEISEEEASTGKLTYLQSLLKDVYDKAQQLGLTSYIPYYYNEKETLPRKFLYDAIEECQSYMTNPNEGNSIANEVYLKQIFARIPLGREVAFTTQKAYPLDIKYRQYNNLLINADDTIIKTYICRLIGETLSSFASKYVVASTDEVLQKQLDLEGFAQKANIPIEVDLTGYVPATYIKLVSNRQLYMALQNYLSTANPSGEWKDELVLRFTYDYIEAREKPDFSLYSSTLVEKYADLVYSTNIAAFVSETFPELTGAHLDFTEKILGKFVSFKKNYAKQTNSFTKTLCSKSFDPIVVWWLGVDNFPEVEDSSSRSTLQNYLSQSCQVGVFNILVPSLRCSNLRDIPLCCKYVLERCSKQFFLDAQLKRVININDNSFQVHNRELGTHNIIRLYS